MRTIGIARRLCVVPWVVWRRARPPTAPVTFTKDVAPILYKSCVECHRPTMFAPMSLVDVRRCAAVRAVDQAARRVARSMPPWGADPAARRRSRTTRACRRRRSTRSARGSMAARAKGNDADLPTAAAVRRRLDDWQARRRLHDGRGVPHSGDRRDSVSIPPRPDASSPKTSGFRRSRSRPSGATRRCITCSRTRSRPASRSTRAGALGPTNIGGVTPNKPGITFEPGVARAAARQLRPDLLQMHYTTNGKAGEAIGRGSACIYAKAAADEAAGAAAWCCSRAS